MMNSCGFYAPSMKISSSSPSSSIGVNRIGFDLFVKKIRCSSEVVHGGVDRVSSTKSHVQRLV